MREDGCRVGSDWWLYADTDEEEQDIEDEDGQRFTGLDVDTLGTRGLMVERPFIFMMSATVSCGPKDVV